VWVRLVALYVWEKPPKKITSPIFFFFLSINHFRACLVVWIQLLFK